MNYLRRRRSGHSIVIYQAGPVPEYGNKRAAVRSGECIVVDTVGVG